MLYFCTRSTLLSFPVLLLLACVAGLLVLHNQLVSAQPAGPILPALTQEQVPDDTLTVAINEIMSSNLSVLADEDGDYENWIELYNYGIRPVKLGGFGLSDDYENPFRWVLPDIAIEPGEFLLIWASGKDRTDPDGPLHTNFGIASAGEEVLLTAPDGRRIDSIPPVRLAADVSFGRQPDGTGSLFYFNEPTPGAANTTQAMLPAPAPPEFSHGAGFYHEPFSLELSHPDPEVVLYYTLDGSLPDTTSLRYTGPLPIEDRSAQENLYSMIPTNHIEDGPYREFRWMEPDGNVPKAQVVRVLAWREHALPTEQTATYFVQDQGQHTYHLPVISLTTDPAHLFDDETGLYVPGNEYTGHYLTGNYFGRGPEWERAAWLEYFEPDGTPSLNQSIGMRIHGRYSRAMALKSLRLYARGSYGETSFNHPFFANRPDTAYRRLILRNSGQEFGYTQFGDAAAQTLVQHLDLETQSYAPVIVFINGEYWGIHNVRERIDAHYLSRLHGIDENLIDKLENDAQVLLGTDEHYQYMLEYARNHDLSLHEHYEYMQTLMDVDNYLDYYTAKIYLGNTDWPHNNIRYWRSRTPYHPQAPPCLDGRFRWIFFDVDRSFGHRYAIDHTMLEWLTMETNPVFNDTWPNELFLLLLESETFKHALINRLADHLNTTFHPDRVTFVVDSLRANIEPEIDAHIARWQNHRTRSFWNASVQRMLHFAEERPNEKWHSITSHFAPGDTARVSLQVTSQATPENTSLPGTIQINTTHIHPEVPGVPEPAYPWSGIYFTKVPVTLKAQPAEGYVFSHWTVSQPEETTAQKRTTTTPIDATSAAITTNPHHQATYTAHFSEADQGDLPKTLHYWLFDDDIPNNTPLDSLTATYSKTSPALLTYQAAVAPYPPQSGTEGILDRVNDPTPLNYLPDYADGQPFEESDMRGIRARNPSLVHDRESALILHLPTDDYEQPTLTLAVSRTSNGQRTLTVHYYTEGPEGGWTQQGLEHTEFPVFEEWHLITISLPDLPGISDNPNLRIRLGFGGDEPIRTGTDGNVRFNNISLSGYRLTDETDTHIDAEPPATPEAVTLKQNYPNPFNAQTILSYSLPEQTHVRLTVYDLLGRQVSLLIDQNQPAGTHRISWDASALPSGLYIYHLEAGNVTQTRSMMLVK